MWLIILKNIYFFTLFCREALADIFDRCDLDGNGHLSREEFDFFQMKSGGEQCDDDAWEIMKGNCQKSIKIKLLVYTKIEYFI